MNLIYVTGVARSGTSAVATLVERMGAITLPKTVIGAYNPDYQENIVINALAHTMHPWHKVTSVNNDILLIRAMASYIAEHWTNHDRPMVVKSPSFPFIIDNLYAVARTVAQLLGDEVHPRFLCTARSDEESIRSLDVFTMGVFGKENWQVVLRTARRHMREDIKVRDRLWIDYAALLSDWPNTAVKIKQLIPAITVPADGGIRPELNHQGANRAIEAR